MTTANTSLLDASCISSEQIVQSSLHMTGGHLASTASAHSHRVDLREHLIFPGLINAHEHLHVNSVPRLTAGASFPNSYAWIEAFQKHFEEPEVIAAIAVPKALRHRHGGLKNLLSGVTTVAHHDPWHAALDASDFPVGLLRQYGWCYALGWATYGPTPVQSFADLPADRPWLIHLAEGTDAVAAGELVLLDEMGCLADNTVLVHGVGLTQTDIGRVIAVGAGVVWCPSSNLSLLGKTLDPRRLFDAGCLALGSDSRLSGARDLLQELGHAAASSDLTPREVVSLVTVDAARILRMPDVGGLLPGQCADLVIIEDRGGDPYRTLIDTERSEIRAVVRKGIPRIADPDFESWFSACGLETTPVRLDGRRKLLASTLAQPQLIALEPGLELLA